MADSTLTIRTIDRSEIPELRQVFAWAFYEELGEDTKWGPLLEPERTHAVFDGDEMIGTGGILSREITLPGDVQARLGAVTLVGVKPGHRRRGVASLLMKTQLEAMRDAGEALGALWASEGSIYRRFGYGEHTTSVNIMTMPTRMSFHKDVKVDQARIRHVTRAEAMPFMVALHDKLRRGKVGWLSRSEANWNYFLVDAESERDGLSAYRYCVHPQGYVVFRVKHDWNNSGPQLELHVRELVAENDEVRAALYRFLLDLDLATMISYYTATNDPIQHMVDNPRMVQTLIKDGLWLRIVDVERALPMRRYSSGGGQCDRDRGRLLPVELRPLPADGEGWRGGRRAHGRPCGRVAGRRRARLGFPRRCTAFRAQARTTRDRAHARSRGRAHVGVPHGRGTPLPRGLLTGTTADVHTLTVYLPWEVNSGHHRVDRCAGTACRGCVLPGQPEQRAQSP